MDTTVLVAIVSASSVLLGAAVSQGSAMLQSWLDRRNKREILLRTKYEELGLHFLESMKLSQSLLACSTHEETLAVTHQESANKAKMLAMVYFPELREPTGLYIASYSALCMNAISLYNPSDARVLGMQVYAKPEYIAARETHIDARSYLQKQIENFAPKYAKS